MHQLVVRGYIEFNVISQYGDTIIFIHIGLPHCLTGMTSIVFDGSL